MTRVAVVDDERIIADSLCAILQNSGFEAWAFYDGESALNACKDCPPDVLISDVAMPGIDGVTLAVQIKDRYPSCEVILFSGQAGTLDLLDCEKSKGHQFEVLIKPVHPLELLSSIKRSGPQSVREHSQANRERRTA